MLNATIPELISAAQANTEEVRVRFDGLSPEQLNWKPGPERWSVGQCLDHLITTNASYFPSFDAILSGTKTGTFWEKLPWLPGFWGKMLIKSVSPEAQRKLKAPQVFQPTASSVEANILQCFVDQQTRVIEILRAGQNLAPETIILTSPVARFITYSLLDAFRIIVAHEQRHLQQAKRVTEMVGFPASQP